MNLILEDGKFLINTARQAIELFLKENKVLQLNNYPEKFNQKHGVFVTLKACPGEELRGCIGVPLPVMPLIEAVVSAAIDSATSDPRFPTVQSEELGKIIIELTVLTEPTLIKVKKPEEYPGKIEIGKDGLIIENGFNKGLLLPQVPIEWKWDSKEFLVHLCIKAGLPEDSWLLKETKIYKFSGQVFAEQSPEGKVVGKELAKE